MNLTDFIITTIGVGLVLTGLLAFTGDVYTQAGYAGSTEGEFANITTFSDTATSVSKELQNSTETISPAGEQSDLLSNMFTAAKVIIDSLSGFRDIVSELFIVMGLPRFIFYGLIAMLVAALILATYSFIKGGNVGGGY